MINWHVGHWAYLVKKLKDTPDGDGNLLQRTALALVFEGGIGYDPASGDISSPHSSEKMAMLVAGAGLTAGVHLDGQQAHPAHATHARKDGRNEMRVSLTHDTKLPEFYQTMTNFHHARTGSKASQ